MVNPFVKCLCVVFVLSVYAKGITAQGLKCGHPAVPVNARVSLPVSPSSLTAGTVATYTCDAGYELFGSATTTCSSLGVWQGDLPFCGTNIAFRKPANQSTSVRGGGAGNANDGQRTTVHDGRQCTETLKEASPWWEVDLLKPYPIRVVRVTTRGCCGHQPLQDLEIRVGNSSDLQRNPLCAWYPGTIEEGVTKTFTCARTLIGQHVFLQLVGVEGSLSLCEVEVYTTEEFSNERCVPKGASADVDVSAFDRTCYEFAISKGGSFQDARTHCQGHAGDLVHGLSPAATSFLLAELEQRKPKLKTQLVWMGAQREPGFTSRTWRWVNGDVISRPAWGKDQPNNYNGEQNCVVLDGGRNWLWNDVGCNLDYLHWVCQHASASCGSPDKLVNTTIVSSNHSEGAAITYKCPEGHMLVGNENRTCHHGFWTGLAPSCKYVDCGALAGGLEHGTVSLADNRTTFGASAVFACHENYTLIGHERRQCGGDGKWTGKLPQCLFDWCGEPPAVSGGSVVTSGDHRSGATATYTCQAGYLLSGTGILSCGLGGAWSGKAPTCRYVDCGSPASTDHGRFALVNASTTHGSVAKYSCDTDYWLDGEEKLTCTREGKWSADTPNCLLITCEEPDVPPGSYVVGYDFNIHSTIEYNCEAGHTLRGQSTLQCTAQGEWSGEAPKCQFVDCGKMPPMLYGTVNYTNNTTYLGSEVSYSCSRNYRLIGVTSRKCLENNQWSGESPRCEEIRCPEPKLPEHSILSVTGNDRVYGRTLIRTADSAVSVATYKIGSLLKYRCERGYKVMGEPLSTCQDNGYWSGLVPECVFVDCGQPPEIQNGQFSLASNATYYGVAVLYECNPNFKLDGHGRRLCMDNGTWSSDTPTCKEIQCSEPETLGSLQVQVMTRSIGGIAHYSCPRGTEMEGNMTRTCTKAGSWSGKTPFCRLVDCGQPGPIENGRVLVMNGTTYNSAAEYHCVQHFERIGPYLRKCMDTAEWSGEEPRCEVGTGEVNEPQNMGMTIGIASGVILFLLIVLGLIYLRLRKATPVKNTENVQAAVRKEEQTAAVTSYAAFNEGNPYGMPAQNNTSNIYENIHDQDNMYDAPYEETAHYEASPKPNHPRSSVTINGVAIR